MESEEHRFGRIAYEAYAASTGWKSAISGAALPEFDKTPEAVQKAWIAAAQVVRSAT